MSKRNGKIVSYRRHIHITFTGILFAFVLIYLMIQLAVYLSKGHVSLYQVGAADTYTSSSQYEGVITRNETVYYMDRAGSSIIMCRMARKHIKGIPYIPLMRLGIFLGCWKVCIRRIHRCHPRTFSH